MKTTIRNSTKLVLSFLFVVSLCCTTFANENVYDKAIRSTAYIVASEGRGSGVLIDADKRLLITNEHVVGKDSEVTVFFPVVLQGQIECDGQYYMRHAQKIGVVAKVVAIDPVRDLALLELASLPDNAVPIEMGTSARPGQIVHSIGNPDSSDALWIYTAGYVRANYFKKMSENRMQVVETSSPTNPGDSGGPILDDSSRLVGITQSYVTSGRLVSNGVDISEIVWFVDKIMRESTTFEKTETPAEVTSTAAPSSLTALFGTPEPTQLEVASK